MHPEEKKVYTLKDVEELAKLIDNSDPNLGRVTKINDMLIGRAVKANPDGTVSFATGSSKTFVGYAHEHTPIYEIGSSTPKEYVRTASGPEPKSFNWNNELESGTSSSYNWPPPLRCEPWRKRISELLQVTVDDSDDDEYEVTLPDEILYTVPREVYHTAPFQHGMRDNTKCVTSYTWSNKTIRELYRMTEVEVSIERSKNAQGISW